MRKRVFITLFLLPAALILWILSLGLLMIEDQQATNKNVNKKPESSS